MFCNKRYDSFQLFVFKVGIKFQLNESILISFSLWKYFQTSISLVWRLSPAEFNHRFLLSEIIVMVTSLWKYLEAK
jgi:hypothetical protein